MDAHLAEADIGAYLYVELMLFCTELQVKLLGLGADWQFLDIRKVLTYEGKKAVTPGNPLKTVAEIPGFPLPHSRQVTVTSVPPIIVLVVLPFENVPPVILHLKHLEELLGTEFTLYTSTSPTLTVVSPEIFTKV